MNSKKLLKDNRYLFFKEIISILNQAGVLSYLILIGGWCLYVYREYFRNDPQIPLLRTADIDFLIPRPLKIKNGIDVHTLLKNKGFDVQFSHPAGYIKYVHPQIEIEFLTPEVGKGSEKPFLVRPLNLSAQQLRYLTILQNYTMEVLVDEDKITVPEPSAFVLHKLLLSFKRNRTEKREKDLRTAIDLGEFLLHKEDQRVQIKEIFESFPRPWKRDILKVIEKKFQPLTELLKEG